MFLRLLLLMTVVPAVELYLLIQLGNWMGALETVLVIVVTGTLGAALAKREGLGVLQQLQKDSRKGIPPASRLIEGLMVLIGGALLITPGVLTDLFGFTLILPLTRRVIAPYIKTWVMKRFKIFSALQAGPGPDRHEVGPETPPAQPVEHGGGFDHPVQ
jgi:UPF0716 protein FxsA